MFCEHKKVILCYIGCLANPMLAVYDNDKSLSVTRIFAI